MTLVWKNHRDLDLGEVAYISIIYNIAEYRLDLLNGTFPGLL